MKLNLLTRWSYSWKKKIFKKYTLSTIPKYGQFSWYWIIKCLENVTQPVLNELYFTSLASLKIHFLSLSTLYHRFPVPSCPPLYPVSIFSSAFHVSFFLTDFQAATFWYSLFAHMSKLGKPPRPQIPLCLPPEYILHFHCLILFSIFLPFSSEVTYNISIL